MSQRNTLNKVTKQSLSEKSILLRSYR